MVKRIILADDVVLAAGRLKQSALEEVLRAHYPQVCRIAFGVSGRLAWGNAIVRSVMKQSIRIAPSWEGADDAANWFTHYTILMTRRLTIGQGDARDDMLVPPSPEIPPGYAAFVRALRKLPSQQKEAFLLSYGEELPPRSLAVAMDCSTAAAGNHLIAAKKDLSAIAGADFDHLTAIAARVYNALTPDEALMVDQVSSRVGGFLARRRFGKMLYAVSVAALLLVLAWTAWKLSTMIVI